MVRSPNLSTSFPENKPEAKRDSAKREMIRPTAALLTPNDRAKSGIAGTMIPKPTATKKDATTRTLTSRGRSRSGDCSFLGRIGFNRLLLRLTLDEPLRNLHWYAMGPHARRVR